jgi:arylsulfatase A-like enzyme
MTTRSNTVLLSFPVTLVLGLFLWGPLSCGLGQADSRLGDEAQIARRADQPDPGVDSPGLRGTTQRRRPNVLLIGIDTLRADHVGCLGYAKDTTPTLDRLAREGVLCTRTMSTSGWTSPSVMSVMTSLYPDAHRVYMYKSRLAEGAATLAKILRTRGYATAGFVSNPMVGSTYGFAVGFDLYDDWTVSLDVDTNILGEHDTIRGDPALVCTSERITKAAIRWLEPCPREPFFLFVFYMDPHYDYIPPAPFETMFDPSYQGHIDGRGMRKEPRYSQRPADRDLQHLLALYDGEIRYTDTYVAGLLQAFAKSSLLENTLVLVFGDHGDEFYEHGKTTHDRTLYQEILHVPLVLWGPRRFPAGRRIEAVTSLVDIMPTVLDYLGLPWENPMQGASLRALIEGRTDQLHEVVWAELRTGSPIQTLVGDHGKLIRNVGDGSWELYDLSRDPREQTNLYEQPSAAGIRLAMTAKWEKWTKDNRVSPDPLVSGTETQDNPMTAQQLRQLKALGYVQ